MAPLSVERAERELAEAVADADRQMAELAAGSRDVTSESLARANARVDFERVRLEAANTHEKELNDPKRLAKIAGVLDPFLEDRFPKHAARVVELHDQARSAMAELADVLTEMSVDARSTAGALVPLRPLHESTEEQVKELDEISKLTRLLATDAAEASTRLDAWLSTVRPNQPRRRRIDRLRQVLDGGQLHAVPPPKVEIVELGGNGMHPGRKRMVTLNVAERLVADRKAKYADPANAPAPTNAASAEHEEVVTHG